MLKKFEVLTGIYVIVMPASPTLEGGMDQNGSQFRD
jgi:hypothetical protein